MSAKQGKIIGVFIWGELLQWLQEDAARTQLKMSDIVRIRLREARERGSKIQISEEQK